MIFALYLMIGASIYLYALTQEPEYKPDFYAFVRQLIIASLIWPVILAYVLTNL